MRLKRFCNTNMDTTQKYIPFLVLIVIALSKNAMHGLKLPVTMQDPQHDIFMSQLDGQCLPGDRDQTDQIYLYHLNDTLPECVPDGYVGVSLELGQYAQDYWKALVLHRKDDFDIYRNVIQMEGRQKPPTAFFSLDEFNTHDLCLWKDVDEIIGTGRTNMYRLVDAEDVMRLYGGVFNFLWFRDDTCVVPYSVYEEEIRF